MWELIERRANLVFTLKEKQILQQSILFAACLFVALQILSFLSSLNFFNFSNDSLAKSAFDWSVKFLYFLTGLLVTNILWFLVKFLSNHSSAAPSHGFEAIQKEMKVLPSPKNTPRKSARSSPMKSPSSPSSPTSPTSGMVPNGSPLQAMNRSLVGTPDTRKSKLFFSRSSPMSPQLRDSVLINRYL